MKKENFALLLMGTFGVIAFALGLCMCLLPEWNAFQPGVIVGALGIVILLIMWAVRRKLQGKPPIALTSKTVAAVVLGLFGTLAFGVGLCMILVWDGLLVWGILAGLIGIVLLLCLIPVCKGLK